MEIIENPEWLELNTTVPELPYYHVRFTLRVLETIRRLQIQSANAQTCGVCLLEIVAALQQQNTGGDALNQVQIALVELNKTGFLKKTKSSGYIALLPFASLCNVKDPENQEKLWRRLRKLI